MWASPWIAALFALFTWWFATGAILWVVRKADNNGPAGHRWSVVLGLPFLGAGIWGLWASLPEPGLAGVYIGFLAALAIWGWIELAFLNGVITGPNDQDCPPGTIGWERFVRAWGTVAYHEMLLAAALALIIYTSWGAANPITAMTFVVLFVARISAKLNLFLGVPKINIEFLPAPLSHLPSHFRHARMNPLFPVSVLGLTLLTGGWFWLVAILTGASDVVAATLLATLSALALLEHILMVAGLPDEKLWRWMIPAHKPKTR